MENDQNTLSQDLESIGVENLPLARIKDAFKKIDTAYHYWRFRGFDTIKAMESVGIAPLYFGQVVRFFEYFLSQENGGQLFPAPRVKETIKSSQYYFDLCKMAERRFAEMSQLRKEEMGIIVGFDLFAFLAKDGVKGIDRTQLEVEGQMKEFKFEEGQLVKKIYVSHANQIKYDHVIYRIVGFEGSLVVVKSLGSKNPRRVHPSLLVIAEEQI